MPEGDSVFRFAARVGEALTGKAITAARAHGPGPVPQVHRIVGATCTGTRAQGKNLFISFDNGLALRGHLRMYGTSRFRPASTSDLSTVSIFLEAVSLMSNFPALSVMADSSAVVVSSFAVVFFN